jgi:hypothetical protein
MSKRASLVCQHLENISRDALEKYQDVIREYVRRRQGVYALYRRKKLYYVGLARDLRSRLKQHLEDHHGQSWDRFSVYFTIGDQHLKELESLILRIVEPSGNKVRGKFNKSQDLRRTFARDIRTLQRNELAAIIGREVPSVIQRARKSQNGRTPVLAKYNVGPMQLRATLHGKLYRARVRRDGSIRYKGKIYNSPSVAAWAVTGHGCDGWYFWKYERAPGDWMKLNELRK